MSASNPNSNPAAKDLGVLLRYWRDVRGKSQLQLSVDSGVSQRHISFVESGRSVPSREMLTTLADTLDVPLRHRNTLMLAAGYAPIYVQGRWDTEEMQSVTNALKRMLDRHEPFPAAVLDRHWNVLMPNLAAPRFFNHFFDVESFKKPRNILHLLFDPRGMRPHIANWEQAAKSLIQRVHRESIGRVTDDETRALIASLLAYPDVKHEWQTPDSSPRNVMPVIPLSFIYCGHVLNYFSLVTTVGTPHTVAAEELRLECTFPADDATECRHLEMMRQIEG